jgi:hypothetical protein
MCHVNLPQVRLNVSMGIAPTGGYHGRNCAAMASLRSRMRACQ